MSNRLDGKTALITGASRGIGEAIADAFVAEGARVVLAARKLEGLQAVADRLNAQRAGAAVAIPCHTGDLAALPGFVEQTVAEAGVPDILVNNAATNPYLGPLMDLDWGAWDKTFDVNLKGTFALSREVARRWIAAGRGGSIVNLASIYGLNGAPFQGVYAMTKAAMISLTKTMALELGPAGIRVNAIAPGLVDTRFAAAIVQNPMFSKVFTDRAALHRYAEPAEIAGLAVYLAGDESSFVTGQTMVIDGGYTIG